LVAEALAQGADTLITCGAVQSNHCRLTLAAAVKEGLRCRLVLEERVAGSYNPNASGNNFLFRLLGVEQISVVAAGTDMVVAMQKAAEQLASEGRSGYIIPCGGSNVVGAIGYVACAQEIQHQMFQTGLDLDRAVTASGSTGTHAGLVTGFCGCNMNIPVMGINVIRDQDEQERAVYGLVEKLAPHVGIRHPVPKSMIECCGDYWRPKYYLPNPQMVEAANLLARTEGILLDPVYTGKAMAGLIGLSRQGHFKKGEDIQ